MGILFITRKFPPQKGGMERAAYELYQHLSRLADVKLVKWGGSNKWLPIVLPYFFLKSTWVLISSKVRVIYLQDGLLAPLGLTLKVLSRKPVAITIHARDITYENRLYQFVVPRCIDALDRIVCVSHATKEACIERGVREDKITVIANGTSGEFYMKGVKQGLREKLSKELGRDLTEKKILLSVGRLVEKKGIHWFVGEVMPMLNDIDFVYLIAGDGIFSPMIRNAIEQNNLEDHVFMLGWADDEMLRTLYNAADVLVMPTVLVTGDMEGCPLVALEAPSCGLPVVASTVGGIRDAIKDGKNGVLLQPGCTEEFASTLRELLQNHALREEFGAQVRKFTLENCSWKKVAERYLEEYGRISAA